MRVHVGPSCGGCVSTLMVGVRHRPSSAEGLGRAGFPVRAKGATCTTAHTPRARCTRVRTPASHAISSSVPEVSAEYTRTRVNLQGFVDNFTHFPRDQRHGLHCSLSGTAGSTLSGCRMTQSGWALLARLGGHSAPRSHRRREGYPIPLFGDSGANAEGPIDTFVICLWSHCLADSLTWEPTSVRIKLGLPSAHASRRGPRCSLDWTI